MELNGGGECSRQFWSGVTFILQGCRVATSDETYMDDVLSCHNV
jgi:hypothetical protein